MGPQRGRRRAARGEALRRRPPPGARVVTLVSRQVELRGSSDFQILASRVGDASGVALPPDSAPCDECAREIATPGERRYRYPFTNCTICGPRWSVIEALPYDRTRTTLRSFTLCDDCAREYEDSSDRRFHAQPIACPQCGPRLAALDAMGRTSAAEEGALAAAVQFLRDGQVCAVKGVGGYQLLVDATSSSAVARLRRRKGREEKPFAVMFPSLATLRRDCDVADDELHALLSPAAPIVLVRRSRLSSLAAEVAPNNPRVGAMLAASPLHRLLLSDVGGPLVCTSGNLSSEPICIDDAEARERLGAVADLFLAHDRPIARPLDDSVVRIGPNGLEILRRARGFVPRSFLRTEDGPPVLCLGGHLKSTITLAVGREVVVSQHLGDLDCESARALLGRTARDLLRFLHGRLEVIACDLHPDYASTRLAEVLAAEHEVPLERVQHHHAHVAACAAEHSLQGPLLGLAWDGSGYGEDGDLWGGEALVCDGARALRFAHLRSFRLPGGDAAIRDGRRAAAGALHAIGEAGFSAIAAAWFSPCELAVLDAMLERGLNAPRTTSVGRLFDVVAALAGVREQSSFEGQAAMELEYVAEDVEDAEPYPLVLRGSAPIVVDWEPLVLEVVADRRRGVPVAVVSARFHEALAWLAAELARRAAIPAVALAGGCFQNLRLATSTRRRLERAGFTVYSPSLAPPNDGGLSLGQSWVVTHRWQERSHVSRSTR
ncbi:carbamoyltransferase HypF [Nannocystis bainbridge]|uniref:Carbamoyltransferase n=1 Tax=Nannocystis bainbridge TaxID=2995303 RepID=A0ABT5E4R9_9BACT|nr:carbamoyltransferase HypF [Nannocystis bainbridge]MDC0720859.1 carbamoyltransferase HypF [Nannocystis bainbridge]